MKELPIIFNPLMVKALLAGRKTQTRRIIKPQPEVWLDGSCHWDADTGGGYATEKSMCEWMPHDCPHGKPGDQLWVRETHSFEKFWEAMGVDDWAVTVNYPADGARREICQCDAPEDVGFWPGAAIRKYEGKTRPSIFMYRWVSRIGLEINEVRVERLQDISEEDAIAEGIEPLFDAKTAKTVAGCDLNPMPWNNYLWHGHVGQTIKAKQAGAWPHQYSSYEDPRLSYSSLWESINGPGSWAANPFVWCISFKVL